MLALSGKGAGEGAGFLYFDIKSEDLSSDFTFTPWSLDLFIHVPFQLPGAHTVLHRFQRIEFIVHIVISVLRSNHALTIAPCPSHFVLYLMVQVCYCFLSVREIIRLW